MASDRVVNTYMVFQAVSAARDASIYTGFGFEFIRVHTQSSCEFTHIHFFKEEGAALISMRYELRDDALIDILSCGNVVLPSSSMNRMIEALTLFERSTIEQMIVYEDSAIRFVLQDGTDQAFPSTDVPAMVKPSAVDVD